MKTNKMSAIICGVCDQDTFDGLTDTRSVATLPFDCKYRLLDFPLSSIANANIHSLFMIFNGQGSQSAMDHIRSGKEWNLDGLQNNFFTYLQEVFALLKSRGDKYYRPAIDFLKKSNSESTVLMGTRMLCNIDLRQLQESHQKSHAVTTVVYKKVEPEIVGDTDLVISLDEKTGVVAGAACKTTLSDLSEKENLFMDIVIIQTKKLIEILENAQKNGETEVLAELMRTKIVELAANAYEYTGYLSNISDTQAFYQANMDMLVPSKFYSLLYTSQKVVTKVKNEVPTYFSTASEAKNSQFATGSTIEGKVHHSLISRKTTVAPGAVIENSIIMTGCKIGEGAKIKYAILDKGVKVAPGSVIEGTPDKVVVINKHQKVGQSE